MLRALVVLSCLSVAVPCAAQTCADGRIAMGRVCCWPGQTVDPAGRTCLGTPECPSPFVLAGRRDCARPDEPVTVEVGASEADVAPTAAPTVDVPLLAGGATLAIVSYTVAAVFGALTSYVWLAGFAFVPVLHFLGALPIGPSNAGLLHADPSAQLTVDVVAALGEIAGAIMIGFAYRDVPPTPPTSARLSGPTAPSVMLLPNVSATEIGARLVGTF